MSNQLEMSKIQSVLCLRKQGWPLTRIARELGIHRQTVARYVREHSKSTAAPLGPDWSKSIESTLGSADSKPTETPRSPTFDGSGRSDCETLREVIEGRLDQGLQAKRIYQDLVAEHGFAGSCWSVMRFVRRLGRKRELPFRRIEREAGEVAQVDFGSGAPVVDREGRRRKMHVFRIVLSHSRKGYSEAVFRQNSESVLRCLENAFHHFGGGVKTLVIENLRAAVTKADWYEPELHPKLRSFCEYHGAVNVTTIPSASSHRIATVSGLGCVSTRCHTPDLVHMNKFVSVPKWSLTVRPAFR